MSWLGDLLKFEGFNAKHMLGKAADNPEQLLLGAADPFGAKLWSSITGKDYSPIVNEWGGATDDAYTAAQKAGINTGPGRTGHSIAQTIAAMYAGNYGANQLGGLFGGGGGSSNAAQEAFRASELSGGAGGADGYMGGLGDLTGGGFDGYMGGMNGLNSGGTLDGYMGGLGNSTSSTPFIPGQDSALSGHSGVARAPRSVDLTNAGGTMSTGGGLLGGDWSNYMRQAGDAAGTAQQLGLLNFNQPQAPAVSLQARGDPIGDLLTQQAQMEAIRRKRKGLLE